MRCFGVGVVYFQTSSLSECGQANRSVAINKKQFLSISLRQIHTELFESRAKRKTDKMIDENKFDCRFSFEKLWTWHERNVVQEWNRAQLIDDANSFVESGRLPTDFLLEIFGYLKHETVNMFHGFRESVRSFIR